MLLPGLYDNGVLVVPALLLLALLVDSVVGDLRPVFRVVPHPVTVVGAAAGWLERRLNRAQRSTRARGVRGLLVTAVLTAAAAALGWAIAMGAAMLEYGAVIELSVVVVLVAQRSLFDHVRAVGRALKRDGVDGGRAAVRHIVGRDPQSLDEHGVARAAIESLAENFADGVVAPAFWYLLFGLPGLLAYKTVNTLDSMVGHRSPRYAAFGAVAARLDDAMNLVPARLAGAMIAVAALFAPQGRPGRAVKVMVRDARKHPSPNAGWPEAAMAGALGVALLGPRHYEGEAADGPWLGAEFSARATPTDIGRALYVFAVACLIDFALIAGLAGLARFA